MSEKITSSHLNSTRKNDSQDLLQEIVIFLYNTPEHKIKNLIENKQMSYYIAKMMIWQYHSTTSMFYKKYKKPRMYDELTMRLLETEEEEGIIERKKEDEVKLKWIEENF